jgi:hypothetical protein
MTQDVLWMTETYFKDNSILNDNVDWKIVQPIMISVQDQYIQPILGTNLFDEIADEIYASTVSSDNQTLLDSYIRKCIIWYVLSELAPALKYRFQNKGIMVRSGENSQAGSLEEIQYTVKMYKDKAEWYSEQCTKFLREHATTSLYANYYNGVITSDEILPNSTNYTTSIFLDNDDCDECKKNLFK